MSMWQNLFLGPYAAFPVNAETADRLPEEEGGEHLGWRSFYGYLSKLEGRAYYMPRGAGGGLPRRSPREMYFGGQPAWPWQPDLAGVNSHAEMGWFMHDYAAELAELAAVFGATPIFGWGLLAWHS